MNKTEVLPIWNVDDERQVISFNETKYHFETTQRIRVEVKSLRKSELKRLKSPDLNFKFLDNSIWYLTIEPRVIKDDCHRYYIGLFLHLKSKQSERFGGQIAKIKITVIDTNRNKLWHKKSPMLYFNGEPGWGWKYFVRRDELFDNCKRSLDIAVCVYITSVQMKDLVQKESSHLSCGDSGRPIDKFAFRHDLMNDREFCDVHLVVGDTDFALHSKLLAAKSSIFESLIRRQKEISFVDVDEHVFQELVLFLYNGFCPNVEKYCQQLLVMAHNYKICRLKSMCDNLCFRDIKANQKAIDAILFADKYQTFSAKVRVVCFVALHLNQLMRSLAENWKLFALKNECLAKEVQQMADMRCLCLHHQPIDV